MRDRFAPHALAGWISPRSGSHMNTVWWHLLLGYITGKVRRSSWQGISQDVEILDMRQHRHCARLLPGLALLSVAVVLPCTATTPVTTPPPVKVQVPVKVKVQGTAKPHANSKVSPSSTRT